MVKITEEQQKFWNVLRNPYPRLNRRKCLNCKYYFEPGKCTEPEYLKNKLKNQEQINNCGIQYNYIKWKWNGEVYSEEEWKTYKRND